ncbi:MAG: 4Fe-4S dicluster domain-containing protein [Bacteroidetes bacterium]|nr:4Fe-4S dicluster domain-containing protein [Bacteroidota bacterium]
MPHDVLLIGGPVYAHHMQYHVLELMMALPKPDGHWGSIAIPYVTYGGISSGVALKESSDGLKSTGRVVPLAMKIAAPHRMTRAFMPEEFNNHKLKGEQEAYIDELVNRIGLLNLSGKIKDAGKSLRYNGLKTTLLAKLVFVEKTWHAKRYPKVVIDSNICTSCGNCVKVCPVAHLKKVGNTIAANPQSDCIHCLNCVTTCTKNAVSLSGDLEKGRAFMSKMIAKKRQREKPESAVYPILENKMLTGNSKDRTDDPSRHETN